MPSDRIITGHFTLLLQANAATNGVDIDLTITRQAFKLQALA